MNEWQNQTTDYSPYTQPAGPIVNTSLPPGQNPPPSRSPWWILGIVLGGCGCGCLLLVGGCTAVMFLGFHIIQTQLQEELKDLPPIQQHLGELQSVSINWSESSEADTDVFAYDLVGTEGSGTLYVREGTDPQGRDTYEPFLLILSDGRQIPIDEGTLHLEDPSF